MTREKAMFKNNNDTFFRKLGTGSNFSINEFFHRKTVCSGSSLENNCPLDVYSFAARISEMIGCKHIIITGCSNDDEFSQENSKYHVIGVDWKPNLKGHNEKFPLQKLDQPPAKQERITLTENMLRNAVIVCSNDVEQLNEIAPILSRMQKLMAFSPVCILTVKEKETEKENKSPNLPITPNQARRPNLEEFRSLLNNFNLNVQFTGFTADNSQSFSMKTAVAVIHKNDKISMPKKDEPDNFKVVAVMTTYNEEDILRKSIMKLVNQGISTYIIDNWSTDSTYEIVKELESKGLLEGSERFPQSGPVKYFEYKKLLARVGEVTKMLKADWFIYQDVDEIRVSPWSNMNLKEAIYVVDKMGYNAIDHTVIVFEPIDNSFSQDLDFEEHFKYFHFGKRPGHFSQIKNWKNLKKTEIDLSGHSIKFKERKVFPYKFLLKHYPIRSQSHGEKKIFIERKARFSPEERKEGLHTHYDEYEHGCSFLANPKDLIRFEKEEFNEEFLIERLSGIGIMRQ